MGAVGAEAIRNYTRKEKYWPRADGFGAGAFQEEYVLVYEIYQLKLVRLPGESSRHLGAVAMQRYGISASIYRSQSLELEDWDSGNRSSDEAYAYNDQIILSASPLGAHY